MNNLDVVRSILHHAQRKRPSQDTLCSMSFPAMRVASRSTRLARTSAVPVPGSRRSLHKSTVNVGGLSRHQLPLNVLNTRRRAWPCGKNALHNVPAVRAISFARILPNLAVKLLRIPAMFGAAAIGGLTYLQYQATRRSTATLI